MKLKEWMPFIHNTLKNIPLRSLVGGGIFLLVTLLLVNKIFFKHTEGVPAVKLPRVEVIHSTSQLINPRLSLSAETKSYALITVRAEIAGRIIEAIVNKGQEVSKHQPLLKIADNDRVARLDQAKANVEQRLAEHNSALKLKSKNFVAENAFLQAKANLETANAELVHAQYEYDQLTIKAPIQGYCQECPVDVGDYVNVGDKLATIVDLSVLYLDVYVSENDIANIKIGQTAKIIIDQFKTQREAKVTYISKVADSKTHSYLVELTMDNKDLQLPEGLTAKVDLVKDAEHVHTLSPSVLILDDQGLVGIMSVDQSNKAVFRPVEIVQTSLDKICVKGLPETVTIISNGAQFVKNGHEVELVLAEKIDIVS